MRNPPSRGFVYRSLLFLLLTCAIGLGVAVGQTIDGREAGLGEAGDGGGVSNGEAGKEAIGEGRPPSETVSQSALGLQRRRLLHFYDFEEARLNNFEDMPINWFIVGRPGDTSKPGFEKMPLHRDLVGRTGYPQHTKVGFNQPQKQKGNHTLRLQLDGGSVGAFLEVGALPAVPDSDYLFTARVRTSKLKYARARFIAYFVDEQGKRLEDSVIASERINTGGDWDTMLLKLPGDHPKAAWIGMEFHVLQPSLLKQTSLLGERKVHYREVSGFGEIDDIGVWQVPRVIVTTQNKVNIIRAPQEPKLDLEVRDLTGQPLYAKVALYNEHREKVAQQEEVVGGGRPKKWVWKPEINRFGWYLVDLQLREHKDSDALIGRVLSSFLWLPGGTQQLRADARRFVIDATDVEANQLSLLPLLLNQAEMHATIVSAWDQETTDKSILARQAVLDRLMDDLTKLGVEPTVSLSPVPVELAHRLHLDTVSPIWLFSQSREDWFPYVSPVLMRYGQRVRQWQMGSPHGASVFYLADLAKAYKGAAGEIQRLAPRPTIVLPWRAHHGRRDELDTTAVLALHVPHGIQPRHLDQYLAEFKPDESGDRAGFRVQLHLASRHPDEITHARRIDDFAKRLLYSWEAKAHAMVLRKPWTASHDRDVTFLPEPLLGVMSAMSRRLANRNVIGRLPLGEGLQCLILDGEDGGMLAAWNESAPPGKAYIDQYLGDHPQGIDIWGNRFEPKMVKGRHRVPLSSTPVFIEGIDPQLALFRASFKVTPSFIESTQEPHKRTITLTNPWPRTVSGFFTITAPKHWRITPRRRQFAIAPGETNTYPVELLFPVSQLAGRNELVARFEFTLDKQYKIDMAAPLQLGLRDVEFDTNLTLERNAKTGEVDGVVTHLITNVGEETMALYAFANLRGYPRQERIVARLEPGQTVIRRFRFAGAAEALKTNSVRVGLREANGPAVLNQILSLDGP